MSTRTPRMTESRLKASNLISALRRGLVVSDDAWAQVEHLLALGYVADKADSWKSPPPPGDPRHGKNATYNNLKCRCSLCKEAHKLYSRAYRNRHAKPTKKAA